MSKENLPTFPRRLWGYNRKQVEKYLLLLHREQEEKLAVMQQNLQKIIKENQDMVLQLLESIKSIDPQTSINFLAMINDTLSKIADQEKKALSELAAAAFPIKQGMEELKAECDELRKSIGDIESLARLKL